MLAMLREYLANVQCVKQFMDLMSVDKKVLDGVLRLVLMKSMGEAIVTDEFDHDALLKVLIG